MLKCHDFPNPGEPFIPGWNLSGGRPRGATYGVELESQPYEGMLKDTIFECLHELPQDRPSLEELKERIHKCLETKADVFVGEHEEDFASLFVRTPFLEKWALTDISCKFWFLVCN